jgi:hypothetical protein
MVSRFSLDMRIESFPAAMREMSSRSSISRACVSALRLMASTPFFTASGSVVRFKTWAQPRIALSGVRSSWETAAMNDSRCRWASLNGDTSYQTTVAPMMLPSCFTIGPALQLTGSSDPS